MNWRHDRIRVSNFFDLGDRIKMLMTERVESVTYIGVVKIQVLNSNKDRDQRIILCLIVLLFLFRFLLWISCNDDLDMQC